MSQQQGFICPICNNLVAESAICCPKCGNRDFKPASYYAAQRAQGEAEKRRRFGELIEVFIHGLSDDWLGDPRINQTFGGAAFWFYLENFGGKNYGIPLGWEQKRGESFFRGYTNGVNRHLIIPS